MDRTEKIVSAGGNPQKSQEPPQTKNNKNKDKPFCLLLDEVIEKAYPQLRRTKCHEKS